MRDVCSACWAYFVWRSHLSSCIRLAELKQLSSDASSKTARFEAIMRGNDRELTAEERRRKEELESMKTGAASKKDFFMVSAMAAVSYGLTS